MGEFFDDVPAELMSHWASSHPWGTDYWFLGGDSQLWEGCYLFGVDEYTYAWHILGDRLIPEQPLWVDRGILHVGSIKSLTFSRGPKGCHVCMYIYGTCTYVYSWVSQDIINIYNHILTYVDYHLICTWDVHDFFRIGYFLVVTNEANLLYYRCWILRLL